jgi:hypothetical protein
MMVAGGVLFVVGLGLALWQISDLVGWALPGGDDPMERVERVEQRQAQSPDMDFVWWIGGASLVSMVGVGLFKWGLIVHAGSKVARDAADSAIRGRGSNPTVTHTLGDAGQEKQTACGACGAGNPGESRFCVECGKNLQAGKHCSRCDRSYPEEAKFCVSCGQPLDTPVPD